jgi:hypothetical protein
VGQMIRTRMHFFEHSSFIDDRPGCHRNGPWKQTIEQATAARSLLFSPVGIIETERLSWIQVLRRSSATFGRCGCTGGCRSHVGDSPAKEARVCWPCHTILCYLIAPPARDVSLVSNLCRVHVGAMVRMPLKGHMHMQLNAGVGSGRWDAMVAVSMLHVVRQGTQRGHLAWYILVEYGTCCLLQSRRACCQFTISCACMPPPSQIHHSHAPTELNDPHMLCPGRRWPSPWCRTSGKITSLPFFPARVMLR